MDTPIFVSVMRLGMVLCECSIKAGLKLVVKILFRFFHGNRYAVLSQVEFKMNASYVGIDDFQS